MSTPKGLLSITLDTVYTKTLLSRALDIVYIKKFIVLVYNIWPCLLKKVLTTELDTDYTKRSVVYRISHCINHEIWGLHK